MKLGINMIRFRFTLMSFFLLGTLTIAPITAQAQSEPPVIAESPCDPEYYESLSARAWLEAQREITQNQSLILKPDSVFQYTCWDLLLKELADHSDEMLSATDGFGSPIPPTTVTSALQDLVGTSLKSYINTNFSEPGDPNDPNSEPTPYGLLAGHPVAAGIMHDITDVADAGEYSCDVMGRVWHAAKCINFQQSSVENGFYSFQHYASSEDKRYLPTRCEPPIKDTWERNLRNALISGPWTNDPVSTYFDVTEPDNCDSPPIPTGVQVVVPGNTYQEHFCIQPGCYYKPPPGGIGVGSCESN
ncbi:MAG: hypothetical protein ACLFP8_04405 [Alphaproteobacteria bacterium]